MPVIPTSGGSQVLNAGSPVPIASSADDRTFGEALSFLGKTLGAVAQQASRETEVAQLNIAKAEYDRKVFEQSVVQKNEPPLPDDKDGLGSVNQLRARLEEERAGIEATLQSDSQRMAFRAVSKNTENEAIANYYAAEVKKKVTYSELAVSQSIDKVAAKVRYAPGDIDNVLTEVKTIVQETQNIPDEAKALKEQEASKTVIMEAYEGLLQKNNFSGAQAVLDKYGSNLSAEDRSKAYKELRSTRISTIDRADRLERLEAAELRRQLAEKEKTIEGKYGAMISSMGLSPVIINDIQNDPGLSPSKKVALVSPKVIPPAVNDDFSTAFVNEAILTGNTAKAKQLINQATGTKLTPAKAKELNEIISIEETNYNGNPVRKTQMTEARRALQQAKMVSAVPVTDQALQTAFFEELKKDPQANPINLSYRAMGRVIPVTHTSQEAVTKSIEALANERKAKGKTLSKEDERLLLQRVRALKLEQQILKERVDARKKS